VVEAGLGDAAVGDGCAAVVLALVCFNKVVFVGPFSWAPSSARWWHPRPHLHPCLLRQTPPWELHAHGEIPWLTASIRRR
jgi:hypothetical protein